MSSTFVSMWMVLGFLAALLLGFYNIAKKWSVRDNASLPVLWWSHCCGFLFLFLTQWGLGELEFSLQGLPLEEHFLIAGKSAMITLSWALGFHALKTLPLSLVGTIRAAGPVFTLFGALFLFGERPNAMQWGGIGLILLSVQNFTGLSKFDGVQLRGNRAVVFAVIAAILGASSGLYDKYLLQTQKIAVTAMQFWFSFYLVCLIGLLLGLKNLGQEKNGEFEWRGSIPLVGVFLILADRAYFEALSQEGVYVLLLSALKRSQIFITVLLGGWIFKERKLRAKGKSLLGVFGGLVLLLLGSSLGP